MLLDVQVLREDDDGMCDHLLAKEDWELSRGGKGTIKR